MDKRNEQVQAERRRSKRRTAHFQSVILSSGNSYAGSIENVSEDGLGYIMSTFNPALKNLLPADSIRVIILFPSGDTLNLNCEIIWTTPECESEKFCIGMKVKDPPSKYREFLKSLD